MSAEETIEEYYAALRAEEPLVPYFAEDDAKAGSDDSRSDGRSDETVVKVGISERLVGSERVANGLREQTGSTSDWVVESRDLHVSERESVAWFADAVRMAWTTDEGERHDFETRWSGTLERRDEEWRFVGMHVSAPKDL